MSILRVATKEKPIYWDHCVFNDPPCPSCGKWEQCGGFEYKFFTYTLAPLFKMDLEFVEADGIAPMDGSNDSILGILKRGEALISRTYLTLQFERINYVKASFPLFFSRYIAIVQKPEVRATALGYDALGSVATMLFMLSALFLLLVCMQRQLSKNPRFTATVKILAIPDIIYWLLITALLAYVGSTVTLAFYVKYQTIPPFSTFSELAEGMLQKRFNVIVPYNITLSQLFLQPNGTGVKQTFHKANKVNPPKVMPLEDAMSLVVSSPSKVLILTDEGDLAIIRQKYCNFLEIPDDTGELSTEMHGFYVADNFPNNYTSMLDFNHRHVLSQSYFFWLRWYTWNSSFYCDYDEKRPGEFTPLGIKHLETDFVFLLVGASVSVGVALMEFGWGTLMKIKVKKLPRAWMAATERIQNMWQWDCD